MTARPSARYWFTHKTNRLQNVATPQFGEVRYPEHIRLRGPHTLVPQGGCRMLDVRYVYSDELSVEDPVEAEERRGSVKFKLCRGLFLPEGVAALNSVTARILAGGQWFQLWRGEVVSMASPELREFKYAGLHRGSLVDKKTRPRNW